MASLLPRPHISTPLLPTKLTSHPRTWRLFFIPTNPFHFKICQTQNNKSNKRLILSPTNAIYAPSSSSSSSTKPGPKTEKMEQDNDPISVLNERIRREYGKREVSRPVMDSGEADKYIQMVKAQQQRGLQKLKGHKEGAKDGAFSYKVDPYSLHSGDYVVHKKVGIGRFVGIKFDVPKNSSEPTEYVFIEYADGMAKLPVSQASKMLYRYSL